MIDKRVRGVPLEQILGWAEFREIRVALVPEIFIPRYRTEFLASQAIALCESDSIVLDLCCGSGAIGLSMITLIPTLELVASDVDPVAVRCATQNLAPFGVSVFEGDLFESIPNEFMGEVDVLVANAPYVPTDEIDMMPRDSRLYEPRVSLDGGSDGLDVHRRIASEAGIWLASGGCLLIETSERQAPKAAEIFRVNDLEPRIVNSDEFDATIVIGRKSEI